MKFLFKILWFVLSTPFLLVGFVVHFIWSSLYCGYELSGDAFDWIFGKYNQSRDEGKR